MKKFILFLFVIFTALNSLFTKHTSASPERCSVLRNISNLEPAENKIQELTSGFSFQYIRNKVSDPLVNTTDHSYFHTYGIQNPHCGHYMISAALQNVQRSITDNFVINLFKYADTRVNCALTEIKFFENNFLSSCYNISFQIRNDTDKDCFELRNKTERDQSCFMNYRMKASSDPEKINTVNSEI